MLNSPRPSHITFFCSSLAQCVLQFFTHCISKCSIFASFPHICLCFTLLIVHPNLSRCGSRRGCRHNLVSRPSVPAVCLGLPSMRFLSSLIVYLGKFPRYFLLLIGLVI